MTLARIPFSNPFGWETTQFLQVLASSRGMSDTFSQIKFCISGVWWNSIKCKYPKTILWLQIQRIFNIWKGGYLNWLRLEYTVIKLLYFFVADEIRFIQHRVGLLSYCRYYRIFLFFVSKLDIIKFPFVSSQMLVTTRLLQLWLWSFKFFDLVDQH